MQRASFLSETWVLAAGDLLAIGLVTLLGFARHGEIQSSGLRPLTTFLPYCLVWLLLAPVLGVYRGFPMAEYRTLWRPGVAALVASPFAAMLRAVHLQSPLQPVFVLVIGVSMALGILSWRALFILFRRRLRPTHG